MTVYTYQNTKNYLSEGKEVLVFCNGRLLDYCFFADTENGIAKCYDKPLRLDKNEAAEIEHHGNIVVSIV